MDDIRKGTCPICHHNEIVEAIPFEFDDTTIPNQLALAHEPRHGWLSKNSFSPRDAYGLLKAYACRSCGLVQFFADQPTAIPIGEKYRTRLLRGPDTTPFR
jgi:hypothetical protein